MDSRHYILLVSFRDQPGNEPALPYMYQHTCSPTCWGDLSSGDEVCPSVKSRSEGNRSEVRTSLLSVTLSGLLIWELMPSRWEKGGPMEGYEPRRCSSWNSGGGGMIGSICGEEIKAQWSQWFKWIWFGRWKITWEQNSAWSVFFV